MSWTRRKVSGSGRRIVGRTAWTISNPRPTFGTGDAFDSGGSVLQFAGFVSRGERTRLVPRCEVRHVGALETLVSIENGDWYARNMYMKGSP